MASGTQKKRGLGRGLDALFQDARREEEAFAPRIKRKDTPQNPGREDVIAQQAGAQKPASDIATTTPRTVSVDRLTPGAFQPRRVFDEAALEQLAESIGAHGILQPLLVRPLGNDRYEIIAGERRWRAAQRAKVHDVPVIIEALSDSAALEIGLIENLQREDLSPIEEAEGYQRLIDEFGHTQDALARQLGKSRPHVANMLRLLKLPSSVRKMVDTGALTAGHARALVGAQNAESLAGVVVKRGLNVRQTETLVQQGTQGQTKKGGQKKTFRQKDVDVLALEEKMTQLLGLKVEIEQRGATSGQLTISYKTLDQLDDVLARLSSDTKY